MRKFLLRLALIAIVFPYLFAILFLIPHLNHIALNASFAFVAFMGALEIRRLLEKRKLHPFPYLAPILSTSFPIVMYFEVIGILPVQFYLPWLLVVLLVTITRGIIVTAETELTPILMRISSTLLVVFYPGFFLSFGTRVTSWNNAGYFVLFFFSLVFTNDIMAYVLGKLLGKKLNLFVSPNKSVIGFISGIVGSVGIAILFFFVTPWLFKSPLHEVILLGVSVGIAVIIGDLIESALKRSANVKDSGTMMMGRGGMMDSIDSIVISLPVFYFLVPLLG